MKTIGIDLVDGRYEIILYRDGLEMYVFHRKGIDVSELENWLLNAEAPVDAESSEEIDDTPENHSKNFISRLKDNRSEENE